VAEKQRNSKLARELAAFRLNPIQDQHWAEAWSWLAFQFICDEIERRDLPGEPLRGR